MYSHDDPELTVFREEDTMIILLKKAKRIIITTDGHGMTIERLHAINEVLANHTTTKFRIALDEKGLYHVKQPYFDGINFPLDS